jgi:hypothetical protein
MIPRDWLLNLAVAFITLWLLAFPVFVGYLIYRPYERHLEWLQDKARVARDIETAAQYREAARAYDRTRARRGCLLAVLGGSAALFWIWYVVANWHAIGRAIHNATDVL